MDNKNKNHEKLLQKERKIIFLILDILCILFSFLFALWLRFDFSFDLIPKEYFSELLSCLPYWCVISVIVFKIFDLYNSVWSFASENEVFKISLSYVVLVVIGIFAVVFLKIDLPRSVYLIGLVFSYILTIVIRFSYRVLRIVRVKFKEISDDESKENIMIIGAGSAGRMLLNEYMSKAHPGKKIACFIDDNAAKWKKKLNGVIIYGGRNDILEAVEKYNIKTIIYAIPSGKNSEKKEILEICSQTKCNVQVVPGVYQIINGEVSVSKLRNVDAQDLLGRDAVAVNLSEILGYISGKVVMVTGGGGSIGSELCRQIARSNPKKLIIFDIYENNAYDIQQELKRDCPDLNFETLIGSVRNTARLDYVMSKYCPDLVFHAAAHKHVPLMEDSPNEAIKNNVFGTLKMAQMSAKYGVKKFVLISTDKAVNPTNIMGASKRLCEMIVQMMDRETETEFVAVRFGNVLGSNGSVIPLFKKQIAEGGPVTVTDKRITRFFMTIPEAVSLVLQAGYYAKGGEIFVLDMGQPVKIDDMARNLIKLSGFEPDVDIEIKYTGLRPGEKLYEELLMDEEGLQDTENSMIHIGKPIEMDDDKFKEQLSVLEEAYKVEALNMKELVEEIVPTYHRTDK